MDSSVKGNPQEFPAGLRFAFWTCVTIAVAVVVRRVVALIFPTTGGPAQMARLDACGCVCIVKPVRVVAEVVAWLLCSRFVGRSDGLCHEQVRGWWVVGAKRGAGV
jgi:hypothetical protein